MSETAQEQAQVEQMAVDTESAPTAAATTAAAAPVAVEADQAAGSTTGISNVYSVDAFVG